MKSFLALLGLFSFLILAPAPACAQELRHEETVIVGKDEIIDQDLFATGESITISGVINGDTYVAGGTILVDGAINGDLIVAGGSVTILGPIQNDIRAFGGNIVISSVVGGNVTVGAGNVQITNDAEITGGVTGGVGNIEILAPVERGITLAAGQLRLGSTVGGNVTYWSDDEADFAANATVAGQLVRYAPPTDSHVDGKSAAAATFAGLGGMLAAIKLVELLGLLLVGVLLIKLAPNFVTNTIEATSKTPGRALFLGFVTVIVVPIVIILLFLSGAGAALALIAIALTFIICFVTKIFAALFIGTKVLSALRQKVNIYGAFVLGLVLITLLLVIPVLGWLIVAIVYLMALGGLLLEKSRFYSELRSKDLI